MAIALDKTEEELRAEGRSLRDFVYFNQNSKNITQLLFDFMGMTDFIGVSVSGYTCSTMQYIVQTSCISRGQGVFVCLSILWSIASFCYNLVVLWSVLYQGLHI